MSIVVLLEGYLTNPNYRMHFIYFGLFLINLMDAPAAQFPEGRHSLTGALCTPTVGPISLRSAAAPNSPKRNRWGDRSVGSRRVNRDTGSPPHRDPACSWRHPAHTHCKRITDICVYSGNLRWKKQYCVAFLMWLVDVSVESAPSLTMKKWRKIFFLHFSSSAVTRNMLVNLQFKLTYCTVTYCTNQLYLSIQDQFCKCPTLIMSTWPQFIDH